MSLTKNKKKDFQSTEKNPVVMSAYVEKIYCITYTMYHIHHVWKKCSTVPGPTPTKHCM